MKRAFFTGLFVAFVKISAQADNSPQDTKTEKDRCSAEVVLEKARQLHADMSEAMVENRYFIIKEEDGKRLVYIPEGKISLNSFNTLAMSLIHVEDLVKYDAENGVEEHCSAASSLSMIRRSFNLLKAMEHINPYRVLPPND